MRALAYGSAAAAVGVLALANFGMRYHEVESVSDLKGVVQVGEQYADSNNRYLA